MASDILAAAGLSPEKAKAAAEAALDLREKQHDALVRSGGVVDYIQSAHSLITYQPNYRWDDMLTSVPLLTSVMGSIYIGSASPTAGTVTIVPPKEGFKFIATFSGDRGDMSLQAALIQVNGLGDQALMLAVKNMSAIASFSDRVISYIKTVQQLLGDPESATVMMKPTIDMLQKATRTCAKLAMEVSERYQKWLGAACEVHAACCQTTTDVAYKQRANVVHLAATETQLKTGQTIVDAARGSVETLKTSLQHANEQFKRAADEFPSGWDSIGLEHVSDLAATATSALNQALPVLVNKMSYTDSARDAFSIFKGDYGGVKNGEMVDHSNVPDANSRNTPPPNSNVLPEDYDDIAYNIIRSAYSNIETIANLLGGSGGNIDWDSINSTDPGKTKSGLGVTKVLLEGDLRILDNVSNPKKPTVDLKAIIIKSLDVVKGVESYTGQNLSKQKPGDDSAGVKKWKEDIHSAFVDATAMWQTSQTLPGARPPATPLPAGGRPAVPDASGFRAQIIGAATTKLNSASSVLQNAQNNYKAGNNEYLNAIQAVGAIQAELSKLDAGNISLDQIRALLLKCIELLVQLQNQINKLVTFFDAIDVIITVIVEAQVEPFLDQFKAFTDAPKTLGGYTMTEFCSILLFNSMLNIRCYFALFIKLAKLYMEVDLKFLKPGRDLAMEIQFEATGDQDEQRLRERQRHLHEFTAGALPQIKDLMTERQQEIMESMQKDVEEAARQVALLPPNPSTTQKQIAGASQESADVAQSGIKASNSYARAPLKLSA